MTLEMALNYLDQAMYQATPRGLMRIQKLLAGLGNPQDQLKFIHVAGTNGKGSTVAMLANTLKTSGLTVGMYISPGLLRYNERICVNGIEISNDAIARLLGHIKACEDHIFSPEEVKPNFFELTLALAFLYYVECGCDIVVLEVGLGGRFDATNVISTPLCAVITTIGMDHMDRLGDTLEAIAIEKAGIVKEGGYVVLYPQLESAKAVIKAHCVEKHAEVIEVNQAVIEDLGVLGMKQSMTYKGISYLLGLIGEHQCRNAATVIEAIKVLTQKGYDITEEVLRKGLSETKWPARFEMMHHEPTVIVDAAHNIEGAETLVQNLHKLYGNHKIYFIMGVMQDKDYIGLARCIAPIAAQVFCVTPDNVRALNAEALSEALNANGIKASAARTIEGAIEEAMALATANDGIVCAFGSFYYLGEVRAFFGGY